MQNKQTRRIVIMALLIAVIILCSNVFSIESSVFKISFTYLPLALLGAFFSPLWAALGNTIADTVGMWLLPKSSFFLGFTLNAALVGFIYSICLHNKTKSWKNIIIASLLINFGVNLVLTSTWLHMMYQTPLLALMATRFWMECINFIIQVITLKLMFKYLPTNLFKL